MTILGRIRQQTGLLIGIVTLALLAFLVPWDTVSSFFLGQKDPNVFGKVNKEAITRQEYYDQLNFLSSQYQGQYPENLLEGEVWNSLVQNKLTEQKFNSAGFILTDKMIWDIAKAAPMFANDARFKDKNGKVNIQLIQDEFKKMEDNQNASAEYREVYRTLLTLKRNFGYQAMYKQYFGAYSAGMLTNAKELDILSQNFANTANIEYVKVGYDEYYKANPNSVKVTDEDLKAYIEKHKSLFKIDDNRTLDYVFFSGRPTSTDEKATLTSLTSLLSSSVIEGDTIQAFGSVRNDSLYISELNTAQIVDRAFTPQYRTEKQLSPSIQSWVKSASIGQISPSYKEGNYYVFSKLIGRKSSDSVIAENILLTYTGASAQVQPKTPRNKEQAKKQADELAAQIGANPSDFGKLAVQYSDDPGAATTGGEIKLTTSQDFPAPYKALQNFLESSPAGKTSVIETPQGYMVINIKNRKPDGTVYKLADLAKEIKSSEETTELARKQANNFIQTIQGKSSKEFQDIAKKSKYAPLQQSGILRFGTQLQGLGTDKDSDIVTWAFDSKRSLGDTEMFTTSDQSYVVVRVSSLFKKGLADPSIVRKEIEPIVRNEKLAKIVSEKINSSKQNLDQLASTYKTVKNTASFSFDNPSVGGSFEPKVGGAAFGIKPNSVSKAIEGKSGVYVIITKSITKGDAGNKKDLKNQLINQYSRQMPSLLLRTLYQDANIEDYRGTIFNQQQKR
ncbi:SurA N-terminal domain-containing protein [Apibacter raozihei]|uniref:peptidylprolyl isomerase n=1 Tax=Apibacter TaxID=1778601 RepID=UPI000FE3AC37|nr:MULTISPECIES: peptidylprolyl isomerase [Apibacter]